MILRGSDKEIVSRTFEDVLGPARGRYFGAGHHEVKHELLAQPNQHGPYLDFTAEVKYPVSWSLNRDSEVKKPHLSAIDAMTLALLALSSSSRLDAVAISRVRLYAGTKPWIELDAVPVRVHVSQNKDSVHEPAVLHVQVGRIRVVIELGTPTAATRLHANALATASHKTLLQLDASTDQVKFLKSPERLEGTHTRPCLRTEVASPDSGITLGNFMFSTVDYMATMGQMAQSLVSIKHGAGREGNLWMRRVEISFGRSSPLLPKKYTSSMSIERDRLIEHGMRKLRDFSVSSSLSNDVQVDALLAHESQAQ